MTIPRGLDTAELVCVCANLRRASRALSRLYEDTLAAVDLTSTQMTVLMTLGRRGPTPLSEVAALLAMDRTSLYRALAPLEKRELVRIRGGVDRRAKEVLLTLDGERHLARAMPHWERVQTKFIEAYGRSAWKSLRDGLSRVVSTSGGLA
jgi:DNA-binding MarR family transcriptional regulator